MILLGAVTSANRMHDDVWSATLPFICKLILEVLYYQRADNKCYLAASWACECSERTIRCRYFFKHAPAFGLEIEQQNGI